MRGIDFGCAGLPADGKSGCFSLKGSEKMQARDVDSRCGEVNFRDYLEFWRQSDSALADRRCWSWRGDQTPVR
jgi:hypothetical protein